MGCPHVLGLGPAGREGLGARLSELEHDLEKAAVAHGARHDRDTGCMASSGAVLSTLQRSQSATVLSVCAFVTVCIHASRLHAAHDVPVVT